MEAELKYLMTLAHSLFIPTLHFILKSLKIVRNDSEEEAQKKNDSISNFPFWGE